MIHTISAWDSDNRICEFEPDAKMPLSEAYPLHGFDGYLITIMATDEYQIHGIEERNGQFIVRAGDRIVHILNGETMVYVKFDDLEQERKELHEKEQTIINLMSKYVVIE